jgi:dihydropteroate synthase
LSDPDGSGVIEVMRHIGVTPQGIARMAVKSRGRLLRIDGITAYAARIIKQEALCVGADLACPKDVIAKNIIADCVLIATDAQLDALSLRLKRQSKSLLEIERMIAAVRVNIDTRSFVWHACNRRIKIEQPLLMGILNITPDSFSGDGVMGDAIIARAEEMVEAGVDIFDVGGESTRPFAYKVSLKEELSRVIPVIMRLTKRYPKIPLSIDTYKPAVASAALDAGAVIINDVGGLRDAKMRALAASTKAGVCIMHMQGNPRTMQNDPTYDDCTAEVYAFLKSQSEKAVAAGVSRHSIVIDPGFGFGKRVDDNLSLLHELRTFCSMGFPLLAGLSRKSFIGKTLGVEDPAQRGLGSELCHLVAMQQGASVLRVHDVAAASQTRTLFLALRDC